MYIKIKRGLRSHGSLFFNARLNMGDYPAAGGAAIFIFHGKKS
ncbi:hypothetical protein HMPREF1548_02541 [Clostridium sp. KLE 1755]|nr:hypothetical protein HMPREF1548_02541 [Clostridium sp. KLE 1755]